MKTTVNIPDNLMISAKKRAVELRRPFRELVIEGLRSQLSPRHGGSSAKEAVEIRWTVHPGGLPPGVDLSDRLQMSQWLRTRS